MDQKPHIGLKRLIAYRQGTLPAAEREALQEHLSLCARCTERLRELRDFEAASASGDAAGPEPLREEAWESLLRHLPSQESKVRPIARAGRHEARPGAPLFMYGAVAALLLAAAGLTVWFAVTIRHERERSARLEQRLDDREKVLAEAQRSLAEAERQITTAQKSPGPVGRVARLEAQVAELTSALEELRRNPRTPDEHDRLAAAPEVDLSVAPRFVLRGQEPASGALQAGGAVNPVRIEKGRITVALSLADQPAYAEYRFELMDRAGQVLWTGRRPGKSLLGDAGTRVSVRGLDPGLYRLRVEGVQPDRTELLGEYVLDVTPA